MNPDILSGERGVKPSNLGANYSHLRSEFKAWAINPLRPPAEKHIPSSEGKELKMKITF